MCRTTEYYHGQDRFLRLKAISLQLSLSSATATAADVSLLPESLTLVFLPRINGGLLEINGSKTRPDSPAFITLHRVLKSDFIFTSRDRIRACDGVVFEVHLAGNRLLHGGFRQHDDGDFKMECRFMEEEREFGVREAEIFVVSENGGLMREKAVAKRRRRRRNCRKFEVALDEIPEERECDVVEEEGSGEMWCCCCGEGESESDGGDDEVEFDRMVEEEMERVRWAVDVGIWVVCLGVGFLVSKASTRNLRRRKFLL
ncbi:uncharacterized protein LOC110681729 [Chenopodium quinoa]|uniref:uncharacterized protein LOC110681729 n=1 Tax=Chenopodium quinoa TaxID=63459 RepID=UPI000B777336|nr:uncharacterized protein LOC110681729 [Chenopodium quinoa]